jgi:hypothetical protein
VRPTTRILLTSAAALPLLAIAALPASAAPARAGAVTVQCGATTYQTWSNGNGQFTPVHDLASTSTLIPLAFGPTTFTVTDPNGVVVDSGTDPAAAKGSSAHATGAQWCTFSLSGTDENGFTFSVTGDVLGMVTPLG